MPTLILKPSRVFVVATAMTKRRHAMNTTTVCTPLVLVLALLVLAVSAATSSALACVVGTGTSASCTEAALDACLPGGGSFDGTVTFNCGQLRRRRDIAPDELARQAIAAVKREPNWHEIKVDRAKPTDYGLTLVHKRSQAAETQRTTCPPSSSPSSNGTRRLSSAGS